MKSTVTLALLALLSPGAVGQTPNLSETVIVSCFAPVTFLRFSPDGRELVRVCGVAFRGPKMAVLFDTGNYNKARTFPNGLRVVAYNPSGTRMATAETEDGARVWDSTLPGTGFHPRHPWSGPRPIPAGVLAEKYVMETPLHVLEAPSRDPGVHVFWTEFSPDGQHLITTHRNGHVKVWGTSSWNLEADIALAQSEVHTAAFAPDGNSLVIGDLDGVLHQWSFPSKAEVKTMRTELGAVAGVAFAADGKTLVSSHQTAGKWNGGRWEPPASSAGTGVMIWNTATWTAVTRQGFGSAAFSQDGKTLALGGDHVELIDPRSQQLIRTIALRPATLGEMNGFSPKQPIPMSVVTLAFSPDGGTLAAGCQDGTVRLVKLNSANAPASASPGPPHAVGAAQAPERTAATQPSESKPAEVAAARPPVTPNGGLTRSQLIGHWAPLKASNSGLGYVWEFKRDGTLTMVMGVVADGPYRLEGDTLILPAGTTDPGAKPQVLRFRVEGDHLYERYAGTAIEIRFARIKGGKPGDAAIVGEWRADPSPAEAKPPEGLASVMKNTVYTYTRDGIAKMRAAFRSSTGRYDATNQTFSMDSLDLAGTLDLAAPGSAKRVTGQFELRDGKLYITRRISQAAEVYVRDDFE